MNLVIVEVHLPCSLELSSDRKAPESVMPTAPNVSREEIESMSSFVVTMQRNRPAFLEMRFKPFNALLGYLWQAVC